MNQLKYVATPESARKLSPMVYKMSIDPIAKYEPNFDLTADLVNGLGFCVHGIHGNEIIARNYIKNGNSYSCTLTFIFYDHFGLDSSDVISSPGSWLPGFKSWYILQHHNVDHGYRPFITIMSFDVQVTGTI